MHVQKHKAFRIPSSLPFLSILSFSPLLDKKHKLLQLNSNLLVEKLNIKVIRKYGKSLFHISGEGVTIFLAFSDLSNRKIDYSTESTLTSNNLIPFS